eukprot:11229073-Karenia_brevis.AAC.1
MVASTELLHESQILLSKRPGQFYWLARQSVDGQGPFDAHSDVNAMLRYTSSKPDLVDLNIF